MRSTIRRKYQKIISRNSGTPMRRTKRRKSQANACSGILGLLCAEQKRRKPKKCMFKNSGTLAARTKRRKAQQKQLHVQELWDSCAQN